MSLGLPSPSSLIAMMMVGFFIPFCHENAVVCGAHRCYSLWFSSYFIIIIGAGYIWKFVTLCLYSPTIAGVILCYRGRYLSGGALAAPFAMMQLLLPNHV